MAAIAAHRVNKARVDRDAARAGYLTSEEAWLILDGVLAIRVWREKHGLFQRTLAKEASVAANYLCEIEAGKKPGSAAALNRIAAVLSVSVSDLLT